MASALPTRPLSVLANSTPRSMVLDRIVRVLLVTSQLELRQSLLHVLESLSMDVITCSNLAQALEVLQDKSLTSFFVMTVCRTARTPI